MRRRVPGGRAGMHRAYGASCATMRRDATMPVPQRTCCRPPPQLRDDVPGGGPGARGSCPRELVAHCLVVEGAEGLTLVDTGFGLRGRRRRRAAARSGIHRLAGARLDRAQTAYEQVRALGHDPEDVRDIVLTHLDLDHAGGLSDFPWARVHVHAAELDAARNPTRARAAALRPGPVAARAGLGGARRPAATTGSASGPCRRSARTSGMIPLHGHTRGHCGRRRAPTRWRMAAARRATRTSTPATRRPRGPARRGSGPTRRGWPSTVASAGANLARLQELHQRHGGRTGDGHVTVFCAHDALARARQRPETSAS